MPQPQDLQHSALLSERMHGMQQHMHSHSLLYHQGHIVTLLELTTNMSPGAGRQRGGSQAVSASNQVSSMLLGATTSSGQSEQKQAAAQMACRHHAAS